jgi:hypothetical protein
LDKILDDPKLKDARTLCLTPQVAGKSGVVDDFD